MAESSSINNTYDMPVMVGAAVVGLIAMGIFYYTAREPVAPPKPIHPTDAPLNAQAAPVTMIDTSGSGGAAAGGPGGGPAPIGGIGPIGGPAPAGGPSSFGGGKLSGN